MSEDKEQEVDKESEKQANKKNNLEKIIHFPNGIPYTRRFSREIRQEYYNAEKKFVNIYFLEKKIRTNYMGNIDRVGLIKDIYNKVVNLKKYRTNNIEVLVNKENAIKLLFFFADKEVAEVLKKYDNNLFSKVVELAGLTQSYITMKKLVFAAEEFKSDDKKRSFYDVAVSNFRNSTKSRADILSIISGFLSYITGKSIEDIKVKRYFDFYDEIYGLVKDNSKKV